MSDQTLPGLDLPMEPPATPSIGADLERVVDGVFEPLSPSFRLTDGQARGLDAGQRMMQRLGPGFCFIVGYAGTGKTTMMKVVAQTLGTPLVVTPTGKAALRVREATRLEAHTIHRWLYKPIEDPKTGAIKFIKRAADEIYVPPSRLVLLDEASMVGPEVWRDLYETVVGFNLKLICIGDGFQLPPVQERNAAPFSLLEPDFAESLKAERIELTEVLRQAEGSPVVRASMLLREGEGYRALIENLPRIYERDIGATAVATHRAGGILICHTNAQRHKLNACMRSALGFSDWMPQIGEPLLVLKNTYEVSLFNGETVPFAGWSTTPADDIGERVYDRWKGQEERAHFGAMPINIMSEQDTPAVVHVTISVEELWGRLTSGVGAIIQASKRWASDHGLLPTATPHLPVNFGYCYTAHKSQGSQWPYVLVVVEPSIDLGGEEGRRWVYTSITRAQSQAACYFGRL